MNTAYLVFVLGILSAFGPFVIDMYLPALPEMTQVFDCSTASVQLGLTFCMVGLAVGQLFLGPMSDKYGRKSVLYLSLLLYIAATFLCCLSESIEFFTFARFLQGLGGSGAIVYSRSCPTDLYSGRQLAKMIAIVGAVNGIAPVAAPVIGGLLRKFIGWRGIFLCLARNRHCRYRNWLSLLKKRCLNQKEFKVRSSLLLRVFSWCMRLPASGFTAQYSVSQWQLFLLIFPLPLLFFKTFSVYLN